MLELLYKIPTFKYNADFSSKEFDLANHSIIFEPSDSTSYKVTEVIRAPAGSRVEKIALQPMAVDMSGYVRKELPDGRIALVPIAVNQEIKSVHSSMHTNQQPPSQ